MRPGLTGVTQLVFADERSLLPTTDAEAYYVDVLLPRKLWLDDTYVRTHTTRRDLRILLWTALCVAVGFRAIYDPETGQVRLQRPDDAPVPVPSLPRAS